MDKVKVGDVEYENIPKVGFFDEAPNVQSMSRLMTFLALVAAILLALISVLMDNVSLGDSLPLIITFLAYSAGQKIFGKAMEAGVWKKQLEEH